MSETMIERAIEAATDDCFVINWTPRNMIASAFVQHNHEPPTEALDHADRVIEHAVRTAIYSLRDPSLQVVAVLARFAADLEKHVKESPEPAPDQIRAFWGELIDEILKQE